MQAALESRCRKTKIWNHPRHRVTPRTSIHGETDRNPGYRRLNDSQTTYRDFNDCHCTEKLREVEGLAVSRSTVRRLRRGLGPPAKRRREPSRHRTRRPRRPRQWRGGLGSGAVASGATAGAVTPDAGWSGLLESNRRHAGAKAAGGKRPARLRSTNPRRRKRGKAWYASTPAPAPVHEARRLHSPDDERRTAMHAKRILLGTAALVLAAGLATPAGAQQKRTFSFGYDQPKTTGYGFAGDVFEKKLAELSKGTMVINQFPAAQLGQEPAMLQKVRSGDIDFVNTSTANGATLTPQMGVLSLHFLFEDESHLAKALASKELNDAMMQLVDETVQGARMLTLLTLGFRNIYSKQEVTKLAD